MTTEWLQSNLAVVKRKTRENFLRNVRNPLKTRERHGKMRVTLEKPK